jgi:ABC-type multidrug transport system fused ATPase/permease subunit
MQLMKQKQIFISYKSEEFDEALWVKESLEAQGFTCWMAPMSITGGASYAAEIPAAIRSCTVFVLILSQKVQQSKWVSRELDQAINDGKTIMPFMLENCPLNDEFKFYLSNIQRYYAYQDKLGAFQKMSTEIRTILGIPEPEPEAQVLFQAQDIDFTYDGGHHALRGISARILEGEMVNIVGTNGAGKSTFSKEICGFEKPQEGSLTFAGQDLQQLSIKERVHFFFSFIWISGFICSILYGLFRTAGRGIC